MKSKLAAHIDHALLKPTAQKEEIIKLCAEAKLYHFASVCVQPYYVALCTQELRGTTIKVTSVVGFPHGMNLTQVKATEARHALSDGADEIEMCLNLGALKDLDEKVVYHDINTVAETCNSFGRPLTVIIETAVLTLEEKILACRVCKKAGATYIKTSSGFALGGATIDDVKLLKQYGHPLEVKAAGGIKTDYQVNAFIEAGATRIGTSSGVLIMTSGGHKDD